MVHHRIGRLPRRSNLFQFRRLVFSGHVSSGIVREGQSVHRYAV